MNSSVDQAARYVPRVLDSALQRALELSGAVIIEGPRGCGKTMTALQASKSHIFLDSEEAEYLAQVAPGNILAGDVPRLLDEWQILPQVWNQVRRAVDRSHQDGQFILTGSSVPADDIARHTGAARFLRLRQHTMTWAERGLSSNALTLSQLFDGETAPFHSTSWSIEEVLEALCVSGFPAHTHRAPEQTLHVMRAYTQEVTRTDIAQIANVRHEPETIRMLLRSLARNCASEVSFKTLAADVAAIAPGFKTDTASVFVSHLERLFVVERIGAWTGKLRSKATLRRSPKLNLADPALVVSLLEVTPERLLVDLETAGFIFESAVLHDLAVYVEALGGQLSHFRDSYGNEIDAIVALPDGRWGAIEVKLGGVAAMAAAEKLPKLVAQLDTPIPASFMAVISGTGMSLTTDEGVSVLPLGALGF